MYPTKDTADLKLHVQAKERAVGNVVQFAVRAPALMIMYELRCCFENGGRGGLASLILID